METKPAHDNVSDFGAAKAKAALERIAAAEALAGNTVKRTREDWFEYGTQLLEARQRMPGKKQFGEWIKANALDTGAAKRQEVRSNAMWMAEHQADMHTCITTNHHPTHLRK